GRAAVPGRIGSLDHDAIAHVEAVARRRRVGGGQRRPALLVDRRRLRFPFFFTRNSFLRGTSKRLRTSAILASSAFSVMRPFSSRTVRRASVVRSKYSRF